MRLTRAHVDLPLTPGTTVALPEDVAAHLLRVLRLREGDACVLFNGDGHDYDARITAVGKRGGDAQVLDRRVVDNESPLRISLVQGIARGEKMDLVLQKATELGIDAVVPVHSDRSEVKLDGERARKRLAHWTSVVIAACEQSGRARVPSVTPAAPLHEALDALPAGGLRLLLDPFAHANTQSLPAPADGRIVLAVGPEGGWSQRDRTVLETAGFVGIRLGPRVLRTETAGLAAIAALQARFGDLG
ncbi:16S rRNA (uracil(1498)-N(3))-methyltransferase [Luteimonas yindakuii]|uniref:16S rRNA (uracil(1498)-N(3))-methyltransferase n=1 Tax=Luteimonas yindakuii TaxID=2565782 RepID=UPI0010A56595|nr:16S rRNA (uracil(1498)-N(3))-methyltransferase [Luteimonas yindakuii]QCO68299.1 16S rRNA (uracil(1498)-N(3))-methyltransferase [Luteimonas yindakuii]